jgi:hypothetical protein
MTGERVSAQRTPGGRLFVLADHPASIGGDTMARVIDCHAAAIAHRIAQCVNAHDELISICRRAESFIAGFEDDEQQEGVSALLADLRKATGRPA